MYRIDINSNNIEKLDERLFGDLKIRERENLQEWIAKNPEILGEDLLIIQKEFAGFNETNERLDLLALDSEGELVIIENKLDDTGRDVVWQALKYTSYCSTLTTEQIVKIYQAYLDRHNPGLDAKESILDFIDSDEDELYLNRKDQRIIFVANNYRKEVTSTVLWLLKHDVNVKCFRAIPYSMETELFLQIEQIIPLPETQEYMIDAMEKDKEEKSKSAVVKTRELRLVEFWNLLKKELNERGIAHLDNVNANARGYIGFSAGPGNYVYCIGRMSNRVELYFNHDADKIKFDSLFKYKDDIERDLGSALTWERLDDKKASRIKLEKKRDHKLISYAAEEEEHANWEGWINWYVENMEKFYKAVNPYLLKARMEF